MVLLDALPELPTRDEADVSTKPIRSARSGIGSTFPNTKGGCHVHGNSLGLQPKRASEALQVELRIGPHGVRDIFRGATLGSVTTSDSLPGCVI